MVILYTIMLIILLVYAYNIFITLFSWEKICTSLKKNNSPNTTFTILVPCHNEGAVIYNTLEAINNMSYCKLKFNVVIIADNCSDDTVYEVNRFTKKYPLLNISTIEVNGGSKPKAINLAISKLKQLNMWTSDHIVTLDADNLVSPTLLDSFDYYISRGSKIVQCRIRSKNDSSFIAKGFTSSFNTISEGFQYAKNRIGLSASLSGTGFSVDRNVWDNVGFDRCTTLTEDLEFATMCILSGYVVKFIIEDYVLNENLNKLKPSIIQRVRWCRGHVQTAKKLNLKIAKSFIRKPSFQKLDVLIFLNNPSRSVLYIIGSFLLSFCIFSHHYSTVMRTMLFIILLYNMLFVLKCNNWRVTYIVPHLFSSVCMYFIILYSFFTYKNTKWAKTEHVL